MRQRWKNYLLYSGIVIAFAGFIYILVETISAKNTGFETKNLWDWMELLIIPAVLAGGAILLNRSESALERKTAEDRAKLERDLATDRQNEMALQTYFDRMSELLLTEKLRTTINVEVRDVARTRTLSIMRGLDTKRNKLILQFLTEAKLITDENSLFNSAIMSEMNLQGADLRNANLQGADLRNANLQDTKLLDANLQDAILRDANLQGAKLSSANLQDAILLDADLERAFLLNTNLQGAYLVKANLQGAFLVNANLQDTKLLDANLQDADLQGANLQGADLRNANLQGANLKKANLRGAKLHGANLNKANLQGADLEGADYITSIAYEVSKW